MSTIICDCGWGSVCGDSEFEFMKHVRGVHNVDIRYGNLHWGHCNDCTKSNMHGRRISSLSHLLQHLSDVHYVNATEIGHSSVSS